MKILVPNYCTADSFEENVSHVLRQMGHEVRNMGFLPIGKKSSPSSRLIREVSTKLFGFSTAQEKWLRVQLKEFKPQIVFCLTQALPEETMAEVRRSGAKAIGWWGDTAANMHGKGLCHREWDLLYIKDHYAAFKLKSLDLPAQQLYEAMNPAWHKPVADQKNNEVVIAGNFYDYRHYLTMQLIEKDVELGLYGDRLAVWTDSRIRSRHRGLYVTREEKSRIFGEGLAVLNSTGMMEFSSVNCRAFEAAGAGSLQIMEYRPAIEECFESGKEILLFSSIEELLELIEKIRRDPRQFISIRVAAAKRALGQHTYQHRLEKILSDYKSL